jgi:GntR family transcriptional regulator
MMTGSGPLPVQVRDRLVHHFDEQGMRPGDRIPSEAEVAALCDVGRSTAREALKHLEQEGIVEVQRGRGRFLSALGALKVERPITRFESVTAMVRAHGYQIRSVVLSVDRGEPSAEERKCLDLEDGEDVVRLVRLRYGGEEPLIYSVNSIAGRCIVGPVKHVDWTGSVVETLHNQGYHLVRSAARIQAVDLPDDIAHRHSLAGLGPWLLITETVITSSGSRALCSWDYHRGDAFAFNVLRS